MSDELRRYNDRKAAEFEWSRAQYEAWFLACAKALAEVFIEEASKEDKR